MKISLAVIYVMALSLQAVAQTPERRATNSTPAAQEQEATLQTNGSGVGTVANELELLRKSLQTLNARLREISEKLLASGTSASGSPPAMR